jgi:nucleoside-diphosphate-sugar epimerase
MKVPILGAAGSVGPVAARALIDRGHIVRAVARDERRLRENCPGAEPFAADLADPDQAAAALAGMDAVFFSIGLPYPDFARYPLLTRNAVGAASAAGVREFLLIGTIYLYGPGRTARIAEDHPREPHTRKGRARKEQLEIVLDAHSATLRTAALLLPDFYGPNLQNTFLTAVFEGAVSGKAAPVIGPVDRPHEFVFVPDVGPVIADLFEDPFAFDGSVYHLGGDGTIVPRAMFERAYEIGGHKPRLIVAGAALQRILGIANPVMHEMVEMTYLWKEPLVLDDSKLARVIGPLQKTSYDEGIRVGVEAARAMREKETA